MNERKNVCRGLGLALVLVAASAVAADPVSSGKLSNTTELTTSALAPSRPADTKIIGGFELRPSLRSVDGGSHTENSVLLGVAFNKTFSLAYKQEFNTNIEQPSAKEGQDGLHLRTYVGYFRGRVNDIWVSDDKDNSLSYEARVYAPTWAPERDAGQITAIRNYFKFRHKISDKFIVEVDEIPVLHLYSRSGTAKTALANPYFENRLYLSADWFITPKLKLYFPVILNCMRFANFPGAKNNDTWGNKLWIYPELTYAVTPNVALGIAYYSDNFIKPNFSAWDFSNGFRKGVGQIIMQASL